LSNFIFMLTHHDVTIKNALEVFDQVKDTGLTHLGCKNIGLPEPELQELFGSAKKRGLTTFMEVVSYSKEETVEALLLADRLPVDYLIGGMPNFTEMVMDLRKQKDLNVRYFPYVGTIVDHPCVLKGSIESIVADARRTMALGAAGINLLAYRHREVCPQELLRQYIQQIPIPTVVAGDIDRPERIHEVTSMGYWGFTIGGAVLEKKFVPEGSLADQIAAVLQEVKKAK
jgi:hypothetical protein